MPTSNTPAIEDRPFPFDVFISYASIDNKCRIKDDESTRWVSQFEYALRAALTRKLGRDANVVFDQRDISENRPLDQEIKTKIEQSAVLVAVLSNGYLNSQWCKEEREYFIQLNQTARGQVQIVSHLPPEEAKSKKPSEISNIVGFDFVHINESNGAETVIHDETDKCYEENVAKLVDQIAAVVEDPEIRPRKKLLFAYSESVSAQRHYFRSAPVSLQEKYYILNDPSEFENGEEAIGKFGNQLDNADVVVHYFATDIPDSETEPFEITQFRESQRRQSNLQGKDRKLIVLGVRLPESDADLFINQHVRELVANAENRIAKAYPAEVIDRIDDEVRRVETGEPDGEREIFIGQKYKSQFEIVQTVVGKVEQHLVDQECEIEVSPLREWQKLNRDRATRGAFIVVGDSRADDEVETDMKVCLRHTLENDNPIAIYLGAGRRKSIDIPPIVYVIHSDEDLHKFLNEKVGV